MLEETFLFLPGVQEKTEQRLWQAGVTTWECMLALDALPGVSRARLSFWKARLRQAQSLLGGEHGVLPLIRLLGTRHAWRAHRHVMDEPRFLDIETSERYGDVTVVGISDGEFYQALVQGRNLHVQALRHALAGASCIVTFNGSSFDLPLIERSFPNVLPDVPHLDLRHICAQAGLRGGLKLIERHLAISRAAAIRDHDGADAILLWHRHLLGDEAALQELVDYNAADVLNLAPLLKLVVPALWRNIRYGEQLPFQPLCTGPYA